MDDVQMRLWGDEMGLYWDINSCSLCLRYCIESLDGLSQFQIRLWNKFFDNYYLIHEGIIVMGCDE